MEKDNEIYVRRAFCSSSFFSCATNEKHPMDFEKAPRIDLSKLPAPEAKLKILYDVDHDGNVVNIRVMNKEEIKNEGSVKNFVHFHNPQPG